MPSWLDNCDCSSITRNPESESFGVLHDVFSVLERAVDGFASPPFDRGTSRIVKGGTDFRDTRSRFALRFGVHPEKVVFRTKQLRTENCCGHPVPLVDSTLC